MHKEVYKMINGLKISFRLLKLPFFIVHGKTNAGFCPICEHKTIFIKQQEWLRDYYRCLFCESIPRQRALIQVLQKVFPGWKDLRIHESSPGGASSTKIMRECKDYLPTQYYPDLPSGAFRTGTRCENLEKMTFEDASFDLMITQDVFEHVMNPAKAFEEIARILKPGGAHIFTVPFYRGQKTVVRATATHDGIEYLQEPMYHANPVDEKGSLVVTDWGEDLLSFIETNGGLKTEIHDLRDPRMGLEAEFLEVFVSRKIK